MNRSLRLHLSLAAGALAVSAIAGWCSVREPDKTNAGNSALLHTASPAGAARTAGGASSVVTLSDLERALIEALEPSTLTYTGERLAELCLEDVAPDLPGYDRATIYARRWAAKNPREMLAWFKQRGGFSLPHRGNVRKDFLVTLFFEWSKKDPLGAAAAALTCPHPVDASGALTVAIMALRKSDPARAAAMAAEHLALFASSQVPIDVDGEDYREIWDFLRALPAGKQRDAMLVRYFDDIAHRQSDFGQLWKGLPDDTRRAMVVEGYTGRIQSGSGDESLLNLEGIEGLRRAHIESTSDPKAIRAWLETSGRDWAVQDPAAAIAWTQQHLKGETRVDTTAGLFKPAAARDFDTAVRLWSSLPDGEMRARAAGNLAAGAQPARKEEVETLLSTLSPTDRNTATLVREKFEKERDKLLLNTIIEHRLRTQGNQTQE